MLLKGIMVCLGVIIGVYEILVGLMFIVDFGEVGKINMKLVVF